MNLLNARIAHGLLWGLLSCPPILAAPVSPPLSEFRDSFLHGNGHGPEVVDLPAGRFTMGAANSGYANEWPVHQVQIRKPFALGKYEVTVAQYLACVSDLACPEPVWRKAGSPFHYQTGNDEYYRQLGGALTSADHPIVGVSWAGAQAYVRWLSQQTGMPYRLPSEAEWEYACRANRASQYCGGDNLANLAWTNENSNGKTHAVGSQSPNAWHLYDMSGNVYEWVQDCYFQTYHHAPADGQARLRKKCTLGVVRGGSWSAPSASQRPASRLYVRRDDADNSIGFRIARSL